MKRISIKEAARLMQTSEQAVRVMIQRNRISGATCYGTKKRQAYYITDEQVFNMMRGGIRDEEESTEKRLNGTNGFGLHRFDNGSSRFSWDCRSV